MATSKAVMRIDNAAFLSLSRQYLRRSGIAGTISLNKRETFHLLPKASPIIDTIPMRDLDVFNFPGNKVHQFFAQPLLGKSIVEPYLEAKTGKDVEDDDDVVNDFVDDDDDEDDDDDDSCDDEGVSIISDDSSDEEDYVGTFRRRVK